MRLASRKVVETCLSAEMSAVCRRFGSGISASRYVNGTPFLETPINQQLRSGLRPDALGMAVALWHRIMLTIAEDLSTRTLPQTAVPACTREEAAQLLDSLREQYQSLRPLARAQVKLLIAGLTIAQCSRELQ
jgi:hypothetical protein